jgi:outer membrane lipoprotein-sorting protein
MLKKYFVIISLGTLLFHSICLSDTTSISGPEILGNLDKSIFPKSFNLILDMNDKKVSGTIAKYTLAIKATRKQGTVMEYQEPKTEIGKRYLMKDGSVWLKVPGVNNLIRLSNKQNFMESNFSNNDVMDIEFSDDYNPTLDSLSNNKYYLTCIAKSKSVPYGSIKMQIEVGSFIPVQFQYFTNSGKHLKTLSCSEKKFLGDRIRASKFEMVDAIEAAHVSTMVFQVMDLKEWPASTFTQDALKK